MVGCNPSSPDTTNPGCSVAKGGTYKLPSFCENAFNNGYGKEYCALLGPGEWEFDSSVSDGCKYQAGGQTEPSYGFCTGVSGIVGHGAICKRTGYAGDPLQCCRNNINATANNVVNCFSDPGKKRTCDPEYRSPLKKGCQDQFLSYCLAGNPVGQPGSYTEKWIDNNGDCVKALDANYLANKSTIGYASQLLGGLMKQYFSTPGITPSVPGSAGYNPFQARLAELASTYPSAAQNYLSNNLCSAYSRSDLEGASNGGRLVFCGCHLQPQQYATIPNLGVSNIACDPLCSNTQAIPTVNAAGVTEKCQQGVCIIDNVTINLINSSTEQISFNQICDGCSDGGCNCSIVNINVQANNSKLGEVGFNQNCATTTCYATASNGELVTLPSCNLSPSEQQEQADQVAESRRQERIQQSTNRTVRLILIILSVTIVLLLLIAIIIFILSRKQDAI